MSINSPIGNRISSDKWRKLLTQAVANQNEETISSMLCESNRLMQLKPRELFELTVVAIKAVNISVITIILDMVKAYFDIDRQIIGLADDSGETLLIFAILTNSFEMVHKILEYCPNISQYNTKVGSNFEGISISGRIVL